MNLSVTFRRIRMSAAAWFRMALLCVLGAVASVTACASPDRAEGDGKLTIYHIKPSDTDSSIERFNVDHVVMFWSLSESQSLFLFLGGTESRPSDAMVFLRTAADAGYRVVSLAYNDEPSVSQACFRSGIPACAERVRERRIFGDNVSTSIDDRAEESIVNRFGKLLLKLKQDHPDEGWNVFLAGDSPDWSRIAVAGHSQGGGMAAFIAKRKSVARVVVLSGGWDFRFNRGSRDTAHRVLADWYAAPSTTPPERWFAAYHAKEPNAALIAESYRSMAIPKSQIRLLEREPKKSQNYHGSVVGNSMNAPDWQFLIGRSP